MIYELCKQLKEAGFSQEGKGEFQFYIGDQRVRDDVGMQADSYYFPTLSELIEACGEDFQLHNSLNEWYASKGLISNEAAEYGKTPEEAVAKLWLELNKDNLNKDDNRRLNL